jgi:hypothetical protein
MAKPRWYVTTFWYDGMPPPPKTDLVWTISRDPTMPGWETDGGYAGYGLTWKAATELADAANAAWEARRG